MMDGSVTNLMFALMFCQQQSSVIYVNWQIPTDSNNFNGLSTIIYRQYEFYRMNKCTNIPMIIKKKHFFHFTEFRNSASLVQIFKEIEKSFHQNHTKQNYLNKHIYWYTVLHQDSKKKLSGCQNVKFSVTFIGHDREQLFSFLFGTRQGSGSELVNVSIVPGGKSSFMTR